MDDERLGAARRCRRRGRSPRSWSETIEQTHGAQTVIRMPAMSESFVDLSYRGLALARRVKLTQVRPSTGYVEMPTPMPVGTHVAIATDDGVSIEAIVAEIHEQIGGATHTPGMLVKPALQGAGADWWKERVAAPDLVPEPDPEDLRRTDPMVPTTIVGKRRDTERRRAGSTGELAIPEIVDDGHNTAVMDAIVTLRSSMTASTRR